MDVLSDINEYLNLVTARWYANRGILYRRCYIFYGPPETGKTALTPPVLCGVPCLSFKGIDSR